MSRMKFGLISLDFKTSPVLVLVYSCIPILHLPVAPTTALQFIRHFSPCFLCPIAVKNAQSIPSVLVCKNRLCLIVP